MPKIGPRNDFADRPGVKWALQDIKVTTYLLVNSIVGELAVGMFGIFSLVMVTLGRMSF